MRNRYLPYYLTEEASPPVEPPVEPPPPEDVVAATAALPKGLPLWFVAVRNTSGVLQRILTQYRALTVGRECNNLGGFALTLTDDEAGTTSGWFPKNYIVECWRRDGAHGVPWTLEFEGFVKRRRRYMDEAGNSFLLVAGPGYNDLLRETVISAAPGTSGGDKYGFAEDVLSEYVDENIGASAGVRQMPGLTVATAASRGAWVVATEGHKNLLDVCRAYSGANGGGDFQVTGTGPATFEWAWYPGQLGDNHSDSVRFGINWGNMAVPNLDMDYSGEVTAVMVLGQGESDARTVQWVYDDARLFETPWSRAEVVRDARNVDTQEGLITVGRSVLDSLRKKVSFSFRPLLTASCAYGRDYSHGDLVTVEFRDYEAIKKIAKTTFTCTEASNEVITLELQD